MSNCEDEQQGYILRNAPRAIKPQEVTVLHGFSIVRTVGNQWVRVAELFKWGRRWVRPAGLLKWGRAYGRFKPGTFFVSSIILQAKHELKSEAARRSDLLDHSSNTKNNKASDVVSKRHQQL